MPVTSPEVFVLTINAVLLWFAYFVVYPRFAGGDMNRLAMNDLAANLAAVVISGYFFYGTGTRFDFLVLEVGWFGFTVASFLLMELPLFVWYARRYGLFRSPD
jgi:hypothetical protein